MNCMGYTKHCSETGGIRCSSTKLASLTNTTDIPFLHYTPETSFTRTMSVFLSPLRSCFRHTFPRSINYPTIRDIHYIIPWKKHGRKPSNVPPSRRTRLKHSTSDLEKLLPSTTVQPLITMAPQSKRKIIIDTDPVRFCFHLGEATLFNVFSLGRR